MNQPTWVRPARTAGMPPPGLMQTASAPGAAASRYNDKGACGILVRREVEYFVMENTADVRTALAS